MLNPDAARPILPACHLYDMMIILLMIIVMIRIIVMMVIMMTVIIMTTMMMMMLLMMISLFIHLAKQPTPSLQSAAASWPSFFGQE